MSGEDIQELELLSAIGFDGTVHRGFLAHPDGVHFVYPLGSKVVILNWNTKIQKFLTGHTNMVSSVAVSPNGNYIASGQINHMGFKAYVYLWDFNTATAICKYELHKVRVESVHFSADNKYLMSLGGCDDSSIIVWDVQSKLALCAAVASSGTTGDATIILRTNLRGLCFLTAGEATVRLWTIDTAKRQIHAADVKFGQVKRNILCAEIDEWDSYAYCGTSSGDVIKINLCFSDDVDVLYPLNTPVLAGCYGKFLKTKRNQAGRYSQGVTSLALWSNDMDRRMIIGAGDGTVELTKPILHPGTHQHNPFGIKDPTEPKLIAMRSAKVDSKPTTLQMCNKTIYVATIQCEIFTINVDTFDVQLHITCHTNAVYKVVFPYKCNGVFATCSKNDIRVWKTETSQELLRITYANFICRGIQFASDGKSIISGWNDGEIRAFTPETGRLIYEIHNAHSKGVTAIAMTYDMTRIVSGGGEGQVRVWEVHPTYQALVGILQEHKGPVSCLQIALSDKQVVSASTDGTCVIWDIERMVRLHSLFANTQFMAVAFHPTGVQVITTGTDRKIGYWEVYDGTLVRQVEGSQSSGLNTIDISQDGQYIATGGNDQYVKLWKYQEGVVTYVGAAHAGVVLDVKFSPDDKYIMSVSSDGGVMRWKCPYELPPLPEGEVTSRPASQITHSSCSERELRIDTTHTPKRVATSNEPETAKSSGSPKEPQTAKSSVSQKSSNTSVSSSKSADAPKGTASSKKDAGTPKSTGTPKSSGTIKGSDTRKGSIKSGTSASEKGSNISTKTNTKMMKVK